MFAKSFLSLGGNANLIGTKTAQPPYERYTCHLRHSSRLLFHHSQLESLRLTYRS